MCEERMHFKPVMLDSKNVVSAPYSLIVWKITQNMLNEYLKFLLSFTKYSKPPKQKIGWSSCNHLAYFSLVELDWRDTYFSFYL